MSREIPRKKTDIIQVIKLVVMMIILGGATQIVASFVLTGILSMMPDVAESYAEGISNLLEFTPSMIANVCVIFPIIEELVFRGLLLGVLKRFIPFVIANVTQALAFGIYHGNIVQGIYAFILGMFIGFICYITGSILYTCVLHMSINSAGMVIENIIPEETSILLKIIYAVVAMMIIVALVYKIKSDYSANMSDINEDFSEKGN